MKKYIYLLAVLYLPMATAWAGPLPEVFTEKVRQKEVFDSVEALGTLHANESVELSVNAMETIRKLHFDDGDRVKKGALLVEMTDQEETAMLEEANITAKEAERQYERIKPLTRNGAASESEVDEIKREYETAKARLEGVKSRLQDRVITAPFDGVLGLRYVSVGTLVQPGDVVAKLIDDSLMKLDFSIPETFLGTLKKGLPITARAPAFRNRVFEGNLSSIDSTIDPVTRSILVRATIPNPDQILKPGLLMTVVLKKNPRKALVISEEALMASGNEHHVFKVLHEEGRDVLVKQKVETGTRWPGEVEILSGLSEGDEIVVHGTIKVREGQEVKTSPGVSLTEKS